MAEHHQKHVNYDWLKPTYTDLKDAINQMQNENTNQRNL